LEELFDLNCKRSFARLGFNKVWTRYFNVVASQVPYEVTKDIPLSFATSVRFASLLRESAFSPSPVFPFRSVCLSAAQKEKTKKKRGSKIYSPLRQQQND
jgi:hypothetical protein